MMRSVRTYPLLEGVRGEAPSDVAAVEEALLRLSQLVVDLGAIREIDLNPVMVLGRGRGAVAVDARVLL